MSDYKYELKRDERMEREMASEIARLDISPQDISKVQEWLKEKELYLTKQVDDEYLGGVSKAVVKLVISILDLELQKQAEISMDEMALSIEREG